MTSPHSQYVTVNGFAMHYWEWPGSGPTLLCLHPSGFYGRIWEWVAAGLSPDYRVLAVDQRGHGLSQQPPDGNATVDYAADVEDFCQAAGLERVVVAGHSLGSRSGMVFAAEHPERVLALALVGGPHFGTIVPGEDVEYWRGQADRMRQRPRRYASLADAREVIRNQYPFYSAAALDHVAQHNTNPLPDGGAEWQYAPEWVADGLLHATDDLRVYAARLKCPVLILRAEKSWELTPRRMPQVEAVFPTARIVTVDGVTQNLELEAPDKVADEIRAFLADVSD
jgi:pimeloyl-ACP methyl ester carboxylesterase